MQDGALRRSTAGTPQGGVISPLLANVYLHRLDRAWQTREHGVLVRYADDGVPRTRREGLV
jgi:retron-type reverse transcriptase